MSYLLTPALALCIPVALVAVAIPAGVHLGFRAPRVPETATPAAIGLGYREVRIPTVRNRALFGWLLPAPNATRTLIVLHGWGGNAEMMLPLAGPVRQAGFNVLLFDARNHGSSDSDTFSSLPRFAEDLRMAIAWLKRHHPERSRAVAVLGHSVGAGAALFEASRSSDIQAVVSIAAFAHPTEVTESYLRNLRLPRPVVAWIVRYVEWLIGHPFDRIAPVNTIRHVACPVLLVHGRDDRVVPIDDARRILASGEGRPVRLLEMPDAGHDSVDRIEHHVDALLGFLTDHFGADPATSVEYPKNHAPVRG